MKSKHSVLKIKESKKPRVFRFLLKKSKNLDFFKVLLDSRDTDGTKTCISFSFAACNCKELTSRTIIVHW